MSYSFRFYKNQTVVDAKGEIEPDEEVLFADWFDRAQAGMGGRPVTAIVLDSPGWNIEAAIAFGQNIIERYQLNTGVAAGGICASACSVLWASGAHRSVAPDSRVGVHEASLGGRSAGSFITEDTATTSMIAYHTFRVAYYLQSRGAPESVWADSTLGVEPDQIHWLSPAEIAEWTTVPLPNRPRFLPTH